MAYEQERIVASSVIGNSNIISIYCIRTVVDSRKSRFREDSVDLLKSICVRHKFSHLFGTENLPIIIE